MIRISVLLVLFVVGRAQAQPAAGGPPVAAPDTDRIVSVYAEALRFIAPRILVPVAISQLTLWGLQGLTALDPAILPTWNDSRLTLSRQGQTLLEVVLPKDGSAPAWARTAAAVTVAGHAASPAIRRAGIQAITQAFFDEMFSHIDPYSRYLPPQEASEDRDRRTGRAGVGITMGQPGTTMNVRSVVRDSPAAIAGIRAGDNLWAIDGQRIQHQDQAAITTLMTGPEGSLVTMTWRGRDGHTRDARLVRTMIAPKTVFAERFDNVLVLRVTGFSLTTASRIAMSVQDALAQPRPVDGIVLDLRDNHGGLLRQAVAAADTFLPAGLVATTAGRDPDASHVWRSVDGELAEAVPLIIMVNGRTASAAEMLAAALADRGRAVVIGSATMGKGLVQAIDPMPDGGELFVTWSQLMAPLGWPLQGLGVLPQVCTSLGRDALGHQLTALSAGFQPMADAIKAERSARSPLLPETVLALRGPCPAAEGRAADLDAARFLIANPAAYAAALLPPIREHEQVTIDQEPN